VVAVPRKRALALHALCGDLPIAISIDEIDRVILASDLRVHSFPTSRLYRVELPEESPIPGWDLAYLLGARNPSSMQTWIIVHTEVGGAPRRFALGCDRSTAVQIKKLDLPLIPQLFVKRPGAVAGAFISTVGPPTGYVLVAACLVGEEELAAVTHAVGQGIVAW
jgi:hypothetical protein